MRKSRSDPMIPRKALLFSALLLGTIGLLGFNLAPDAHADGLEPTLYNPRPLPDDIILPMPEGAEMVFRKVPIPGQGFWGSQERVIQIGDAAGGIFEGLQRTQIAGSFAAPDGTWYLVMAKYELTKGQYIALMGLEKFLAVSGDAEDRNLPNLRGRALRDAVLRPLTFVSYQDVQDFIRQYNAWLFDPDAPERAKPIPRLDDIPGFLRLPTEEEWEFVARGGLPALTDTSFTRRLPFAERELNEHAWHLGNARHQTRPIGLRAASNLGLHDLFGNAQEMTADLFRPEVGQGKPGGIAVRGGSVSTPANEIRSALRAELDVYAWNSDHQRMEERRSFNTGARLAIGSNVVVSSAQRAAIEQEYEDYRSEIRRALPVGRSLDNLVAQANVQLGSADSIIDSLLEQYEELREPLLALQSYTERARERLDVAQREGARSLAQDAARNGVNLSVYLSRIERLENSRRLALQLLELSSRYQEQVDAVDQSLTELNVAVQDQWRGYQEKLQQFGEYPELYIDWALETLRAGDPLPREQVVLDLLTEHAQEYTVERRVNDEAWLQQFKERFAGFDG